MVDGPVGPYLQIGETGECDGGEEIQWDGGSTGGQQSPGSADERDQLRRRLTYAPLCIFITLGNEQDEERKRFAQMSSDVELYPSVFGTALRMPKRGAQYSVPMPRLNTKLIQTSDIRLSRMPMSNTMAEYKHPNTA
jgi:hypothetical protein